MMSRALSSGCIPFAILLLIFYSNPYLPQWMFQNSETEEFILETGVKGLGTVIFDLPN